jgi:hypothetical protein
MANTSVTQVMQFVTQVVTSHRISTISENALNFFARRITLHYVKCNCAHLYSPSGQLSVIL